MNDTPEKRIVTKKGVVVSTKMDKTIVVAVQRTYKHRIYRKVIRSTKKYKAHDEKEQCREGDIVEIKECRPLSKQKCWELYSIVRKSNQ